MHCLTLLEFSITELQEILQLAAAYKAQPEEFSKKLQGKNIALLFEKPSTRTRISFEAGINRLGADAIVLRSQELQLSRGESLKDTARVFSRLCDAVMIRALKHETVATLAEHSSIPIINGLTDMHHPCQAIADFQTIAENGIAFNDANICFLGDGNNNVCHSLILAAALLKASVTVACPQGFEPAADILDAAEKLGLVVTIERDVHKAVENCNVLYTDVWVSMGQEAESEQRKKVLAPYQLNAAVMNIASNNAIILHCLPAEKGFEITEETFESKASRIFDQAENRLHAQNALMMSLNI